MNLAVHGLTGDIREANSYYDDLHGAVGRFDYVMAKLAVAPFTVMVGRPLVDGDLGEHRTYHDSLSGVALCETFATPPLAAFLRHFLMRSVLSLQPSIRVAR